MKAVGPLSLSLQLTQWVPIGDQATQVSVLVYFELADVHDFYYDFAAGGGLSCSQQYSHC